LVLAGDMIGANRKPSGIPCGHTHYDITFAGDL
jgi:hypothetical protein